MTDCPPGRFDTGRETGYIVGVPCGHCAAEFKRLTEALRVETICHKIASDSNHDKRAEIERLQAKYDVLVYWSNRYRDEAQRLRAALERIANAPMTLDPVYRMWPCEAPDETSDG